MNHSDHLHGTPGHDKAMATAAAAARAAARGERLIVLDPSGPVDEHPFTLVREDGTEVCVHPTGPLAPLSALPPVTPTRVIHIDGSGAPIDYLRLMSTPVKDHRKPLTTIRLAPADARPLYRGPR